jgi:hypothetical protein
MKRMDKKAYAKERVFKYFFLNLYSDVLGKYFTVNRAKRIQLRSSTEAIQYADKTRKELASIVKFRKIPAHWFEVFYDLLTTGKYELPLHEGMTLFVNNYQIKEDAFDKHKVKTSKSKSVSIEITSQVSPTEIKTFIDNNSETISELTTLLNLPKIDYAKMPNFEEGFWIHLMKDYKGLSDEQIAKRLTGEYSKKGINLTFESNSVGKTAKNYRRYLRQKI